MKTLNYIAIMAFIINFLPLCECDAQWNFNGTHIYNTNTGSVAIGHNSPSYLLHVAKNSVGPTIAIHNMGGIGGAQFEMIDQVSGADWKFKATNAGGFKIRDHANGLDVFQIEPNGIANTLYIDNQGRIGVGTDLPEAKLQVSADASHYIKLGNTDEEVGYFYHMEDPADGDGQCALKAFRNRPNNSASPGSGYGYTNINTALHGFNNWGDLYTFAIAGHGPLSNSRTGGILGSYFSGTYWGSLGYKNSAFTSYGGYFTSYTSGSGKSSQNANIGIGAGAWGDLFGADIHGKIYGAYVEGGNYALYTNGDVYKNRLDIHLQDNGSGVNTPLYTYVSTDVCVQTSGVANLSSGRATIEFDETFTNIVSDIEPIIVTVTPLGSSGGIYISEVNADGFTVRENNEGKSDVMVNYIAIGKRAGYENPQLASEVIEKDYTEKITRGLHNDNDLESNGEGLYYENGKLVVGIHPSTLPEATGHVVEDF